MRSIHPRETRLKQQVLWEVVEVLVFTKKRSPPTVPPLLRIRATSTMVMPFTKSKMNPTKWKR